MRRKLLLTWTLASGLAIVGCGNTGSADRAGGGDVEIPADTELYIQLDHAIDSAKAKVGDHATGKLQLPVVVNGKDVIPKETEFNLRVTNVNHAQNAGDQGLLTLAVDSFDLHGSKTGMQATQLTAQGQPLPPGTDPKAQAPHLPLKENQAVTDAAFPAGRILSFRTTQPYRFHP